MICVWFVHAEPDCLTVTNSSTGYSSTRSADKPEDQMHRRNHQKLHLWVCLFFVSIILFFVSIIHKGGSGASGRVLPPVTGRSRVRVAVSSHGTGEGKTCH